MTTALWTRKQVSAMIRHPQAVAEKILGHEGQPATVRLIRALGIACLRGPSGSTLGLHTAGGRLHLYSVPAGYEPARASRAT